MNFDNVARDCKTRLSGHAGQGRKNLGRDCFLDGSAVVADRENGGLAMRFATASDIGIKRFESVNATLFDQGGQGTIDGRRGRLGVRSPQEIKQFIR